MTWKEFHVLSQNFHIIQKLNGKHQRLNEPEYYVLYSDILHHIN